LVAAAACTADRAPTAVAPGSEPGARAVAPVPRAAAALAGRPVNTLQDLTDPDVGFGPGIDDGVCDNVDGITVGSLCSLRAAIQNHNALGTPGGVIAFDLGAGVPKIRLSRQLPDVEGTVTIDGATGGATRVELDGTDANASCCGIGLTLRGRASQIRNMVLNHFDGTAVRIVVVGPTGGEHVVADNLIGTEANGTAVAANGRGIDVSTQPFGNPAGGNRIVRNVIGGSQNYAVHVSISTNNVIQGNWIGIGVDGVTAIPNRPYGVHLGGKHNLVGGPEIGDANTIVATQGPLADPNGGSGIRVAADSNRVENNYVGTVVSRVLPNAGQGVVVAPAGRGTRVSGNTIVGNLRGGVQVVAATSSDLVAGTVVSGNTIRDNRYFGVEVSGEQVRVVGNAISGTVQADSYGGAAGGGGVLLPNARRVTIRENAISGSAALGIDWGRNGVTPNDAGDLDGAQNFPVLTSATSSATGTTIRGTLSSRAATTVALDFYASPTCDPAGHGEGQTWLGSTTATTAANGQVAFAAQLSARPAVGSHVTATATAPDSTTSEFSACRQVTTGVPNQPPLARAGGPYAGKEGANVALTSAGSVDPEGGALTYLWEFGDGATSNQPYPLKSYADNGSYAVKLTVTDPLGASASATATVTIANVAPTGALGFVGSSGVIYEGDAYVIQMTGTDAGPADRPSLEYALDCGQGAGFTPWDKVKKSLLCPVVPDQRSLTVRGKVRDTEGAEAAYAKALVVLNAAPVVDPFAATSFTSIPVGSSFSVVAFVADAGVNDAPWSYSIVWGDGTPATNGTVAALDEPITGAHTYTRAGTFQPWIWVTDKEKALVASAKLTVTVYPAPAPRIAFVSTRDGNEEIYTASPDGSGVTRLTNDPASDREPAWSPDGTRIAFVRAAGVSQTLYVMNADGTGARFLYGGARNPAWSRDGRIAFTYASGALYAINPDGTGAAPISPFPSFPSYDEPAWSPAWSPGGLDLAFTRGGEIHSVSSRQLTTGGGRSPAWSPNGARIAFVSDRHGNPEIYVMNAGGSGLTRLTSNAAADTDPTWSADGTRIAFVSDRDGVKDLYVMNADGSGAQRRPVGATGGTAWRP
jgi:hypothetical protein